MPVVLQFCGFTSFVSRAIAYGTQADSGIAHVDAVDRNGNLWGAQNEDGLGGMPSGVQIRPADYGDSSGMVNPIRVSVPATDAQAECFWGFMQDQLGKPYDLSAIAAFIADRDWHDPNAWFCSEVIAAALETAGIIKPMASPANKVTPQELLLVCTAIGEVVK